MNDNELSGALASDDGEWTPLTKGSTAATASPRRWGDARPSSTGRASRFLERFQLGEGTAKAQCTAIKDLLSGTERWREHF